MSAEFTEDAEARIREIVRENDGRTFAKELSVYHQTFPIGFVGRVALGIALGIGLTIGTCMTLAVAGHVSRFIAWILS